MKYARVLLGHCPQETTQIFIDFYTGNYRPKKETVHPVESQAEPPSAVRNLAAYIPLPYVGSNTPTRSQPVEAQLPQETEPTPDIPVYHIPKPRTAFSSFVDHPAEFITFLESLITQKPWNEADKIDLYTTLFEMYLDNAKKSKEASEKQDWETKAKKLIEGKDVSFGCTSFPSIYLTNQRSRYRHRMFCFCRIYQTLTKEWRLSKNKLVSGLTYSALTLRPRTLKE